MSQRRSTGASKSGPYKKPILAGIHPASELLPLSRVRSSPVKQLTIPKHDLPEYESRGWSVLRENKQTFRIKKPKPKAELLEHRVWTVLYKMGFPLLSGEAGAILTFDSTDSDSPRQQIDVVAVDNEVAIAVECKSHTELRKSPSLVEKITKHASIRRAFADAVARGFGATKRSVATPMVTWDLRLTDDMRKRAVHEQVAVLDLHQLEYYEALVKHLGHAARYQLLADLFRGRDIPGLTIRVPALRTKMGPIQAYTFAVRPDYLLKICYVAHRAQGRPGDLDVYQRMLSKKRLADIAQYISSDGMFPTNIVINFTTDGALQFQHGQQVSPRDERPGGVFGWLSLSPTYGSAWVIDGQHRLFGYAGHPRAGTSFLNVLAFNGLNHEAQTAMFVDINSEQRKVPRKLLLELDALLKWDSPDEDERIAAIVSKAVMDLDHLDNSPLVGRILLQDVRRTATRCISLPALVGELKKRGFFVRGTNKEFREYGFFWRTDATACCRRTVQVVSAWLAIIESQAGDWWDLGAAEGGGLAMNDGMAVCIRLLGSVLWHLDGHDQIGPLADEEVVARVQPYAEALGQHFASMGVADRIRFRSLRGNEGRQTRFRECQVSLRKTFPEYDPEGLQEWCDRRDANVNNEARQVIDAIEMSIQDQLLEMLKRELGPDSNHRDQWWFKGVPLKIRKKINERREEQGGGELEEYFDLVDYRDIIQANWALCREVFAEGERRNVGKDSGTKWLVRVVRSRNDVMHASKRVFLAQETLEELQRYRDWLEGRVLQWREANGETEGAVGQA